MWPNRDRIRFLSNVCDTCHGEKSFEVILGLALKARSTKPLAIAEGIFEEAALPMLGCEHAGVAAGSLLAAIRNLGQISVTEAQIVGALNRTRKQAIGTYCGLTGR